MSLRTESGLLLRGNSEPKEAICIEFLEKKKM